MYDEPTVKRIALVTFYRQLGFSIKETKMIIDANQDQIIKALQNQLEQMCWQKEQIEELMEKAQKMILELQQR